MKRHFPNQYCIYLDQFAVSNLVDNHPDWLKIKQMLLQGFAQKILLCPLSMEHFAETSSRADEKAILTHEFLNNLSAGYCFKHEAYISAQLLISAVRKNNITRNTFLTSKLNPAFSYKESLDKFRADKRDLNSMMKEAFSFSNELRQSTRNKYIKNDVQFKMMSAIKSLAKNDFYDRLYELITTKGIRIRGVEFENKAVPHWIDLVLDIMMKKNKMLLFEAKALLKYLEKFGFEQISTLDIRTTLTAYSAVRQKHEDVNDQIDIMRISTALQVSDIMLVDKERKFELIETGLDNKYGTLLLSGTKQDIQTFETLLQRIVV